MGFPSIPQWPTGWLPFANVHVDDGEDEDEMTMVKMNHQQILKCSKFGKGLNATSKYILGMFEKSSIGGTYVFLLAGTYLEWNVEKTKQTPPLRLTWQCVCVCVS